MRGQHASNSTILKTALLLALVHQCACLSLSVQRIFLETLASSNFSLNKPAY